MNPTLLSFFTAAENPETRLSSLLAAVDWVSENPDDKFVKNNPMLAYTILYLIKHNKFPKISKKTITEKIPQKEKFDIKTVRKEILQDLASNPPRSNLRIFDILESRITEARTEFNTIHKPTIKNKKTVIVYTLSFSYQKQCNRIYPQHEIGILDNELPKKFKSWKSLLIHLMKLLALCKEMFQIGTPSYEPNTTQFTAKQINP